MFLRRQSLERGSSSNQICFAKGCFVITECINGVVLYSPGSLWFQRCPLFDRNLAVKKRRHAEHLKYIDVQ